MKLVILDRNGTINVNRDDFVKSDVEWTPLPGALEAVARLNHAGWHVVIASNQSGLGRGLFDVASLNLMHAKMYKMLASVGGRVDAVFYCPHSPDENCNCRKPKPTCFSRSETGMASIWPMCRPAVTACATCKPARLSVVSRIWC